MIAERTRDKIAAARRKGKWTGGVVPLGFDGVEILHVQMEEESDAYMNRQYLDPVFFVHQHESGLVSPGLGVRHARKMRNDDHIALGCLVRRCTVDADGTGTSLAVDCIGGEAISGRDVPDFDKLILEDVRGLHQVGINADTSLVVKIGLCDDGSVNLANQHLPLHECFLL